VGGVLSKLARELDFAATVLFGSLAHVCGPGDL
jgi:hypothetical protein